MCQCPSGLSGTLQSHAECRSNLARGRNGKNTQVPFRLQIFRLFPVAGYCWWKPGGMWGCCHVAFCRGRVAACAWEEEGLSTPRGQRCHRGDALCSPSPASPTLCGLGFGAVAKCPSLAPGCFSVSVTSGALLRVPRKRP